MKNIFAGVRHETIKLALRTGEFDRKRHAFETTPLHYKVKMDFFETPLLNQTLANREYRRPLLNSEPPTSANFLAAAKATIIPLLLPQTENKSGYLVGTERKTRIQTTHVYSLLPPANCVPSMM